MNKKLILTCLSLAAFAVFVVLPASASATRLCETQADDTTCNNIAVGSLIRGHLVGNNAMTDANGNTLWTCSAGTLTGTLRKNSEKVVEADIESASLTGTGAGGECTSSFGGFTTDMNVGNGVPWCLKANNSDTFTIRGNACSKELRSTTFVLTSTTAGTCKYNRVNAVEGVITTDNQAGTSEDAQITLSAVEWTKEEGGLLCPSLGKLDMTFTLETDKTAATEPLYFKEG